MFLLLFFLLHFGFYALWPYSVLFNHSDLFPAFNIIVYRIHWYFLYKSNEYQSTKYTSHHVLTGEKYHCKWIIHFKVEGHIVRNITNTKKRKTQTKMAFTVVWKRQFHRNIIFISKPKLRVYPYRVGDDDIKVLLFLQGGVNILLHTVPDILKSSPIWEWRDSTLLNFRDLIMIWLCCVFWVCQWTIAQRETK